MSIVDVLNYDPRWELLDIMTFQEVHQEHTVHSTACRRCGTPAQRAHALWVWAADKAGAHQHCQQLLQPEQPCPEGTPCFAAPAGSGGGRGHPQRPEEGRMLRQELSEQTMPPAA